MEDKIIEKDNNKTIIENTFETKEKKSRKKLVEVNNNVVKENNFFKCIFNGVITENPTFVLMIGMCPTLAITTSVSNAIGMGLATTVVLVASNAIISFARKIIPDSLRIPIYIVIIASFVTLVEFIIKAYFPLLDEALGIYIPLIVVNCIIFGRAEAFAGKNTVINSIGDGIGMGLGFTIGIIAISAIRELIGSGAIYGHVILPEDYRVSLFVLPPGAFLVLAFLTAIQNRLKLPSSTNKKGTCNNDCMNCSMSNNNKVEEEQK